MGQFYLLNKEFFFSIWQIIVYAWVVGRVAPPLLTYFEGGFYPSHPAYIKTVSCCNNMYKNSNMPKKLTFKFFEEIALTIKNMFTKIFRRIQNVNQLIRPIIYICPYTVDFACRVVKSKGGSTKRATSTVELGQVAIPPQTGLFFLIELEDGRNTFTLSITKVHFRKDFCKKKFT